MAQSINYSVVNSIQSRYSCRTFQNTPISTENKSELLQFIIGHQTGPFCANPRFQIGTVKSGLAILKRLNTYGFIKGTDEFLIGAMTQSIDRLELEEFGYVLERIILRATSLGLGTCWMGGTFRKSIFRKMISLKEDEILPAVIAIGYPAEKQGVADYVIRGFVKATRRRSWDKLFFLEDFSTPLIKEEAGAFSTALEMLRLAPSASNRQPWRIVKNSHGWHFFLQRTEGYQDQPILKMTNKADLQRIDMGIAMCHFEQTLNEMEITGKWHINTPQITLPNDLTEYKVSWIPKANST
jgi:nitroreductase